MPSFSARFKLLKYPPFFTYMLGFLFAAIGNGLGYIAMSWVVVTQHSDVSAIAILMACFWGPNVVLSPLVGVFADRLPRKWIIVFSNLIRACVFILFSIYLTEHFSISMVYIMMLCVGISFSAFFACASAFFRELVPPEQLMYANALIDMTYETGNLIGMGSAGLLIAWTSAETAILINGIAFLIATITTILIPKKSLRYGSDQQSQKIQIVKDYIDGLHYLLKRKKLMAVYTIQLLIFITYLTTPLLLVPFSKTILHATAEEFGIIEAFASIGIVIGGIFMPLMSEMFGLLRTLLFFCVVLCVTFLLFGYNRSISIASLLYFFIGFSGAIWPLIITKAQALTDIDFQGRVQSTFNSISGAMMMLFYFSIGILGNYVGVNHLYFMEVGITVLAIVFLLRSKKDFIQK